MSPEEEEELMEEYKEMQEAKEKETFASNALAARNVTFTINKVYEEVSGSRGS